MYACGIDKAGLVNATGCGPDWGVTRGTRTTSVLCGMRRVQPVAEDAEMDIIGFGHVNMAK